MQHSKVECTAADTERLRRNPRNRFCEFEYDTERKEWDMAVVRDIVERAHAHRVAILAEDNSASATAVRAAMEAKETNLGYFLTDHPKLGEMLLGERILTDERVYELLIALIDSKIAVQRGQVDEQQARELFASVALPRLLKPTEAE